MSSMFEGKFGNRDMLPYSVVRSGQRVKVVGLSGKSPKMVVEKARAVVQTLRAV